MLISSLWLAGKNLQTKAIARKLGLGQGAYWLKGEPIAMGPKKGQLRQKSELRIDLSEKEELGEHMAEVEKKLDDLYPFLSALRDTPEAPEEIWLCTGTTVGSDSHFTRKVQISSPFLTKLGAMGISYEVNAYPCSDDETNGE